MYICMKKLFIIVSSVILALVTSCSHLPAKTVKPVSIQYHKGEQYVNTTLIRGVYIDADFTSEQRFMIEEALGNWNETLNGYIEFKVLDDHKKLDENFVLGHNELVFIQSVMGDPDSGTLGVTNGAPGDKIVMYVDNLKRINDPLVVYLHEIGHAVGAEHSGHKGSLLFPYYVNQAVAAHCIDNYTIDEVVKNNYYMDKKNINYCVIP